MDIRFYYKVSIVMDILGDSKLFIVVFIYFCFYKVYVCIVRDLFFLV